MAAVLMAAYSCTSEKYKTVMHTDENGYTYETVANDPMKTRVYTLENGLKVYLSENKDEPRVTTLIAVKAGSTSDPDETTGLAHYFEHMMFKGTDEIGTIDWKAEKILLDEITELFEQHRQTDDPEEKMRIYKSIDSVSALAATYVAPNEYDKLVSGIGAKSTNAGTSYDYTVYINDIPNTELEKWLMLESERFSDIVLRLFHTELETVYEEFNMYQDMDRSRANNAMMKALFPNHPYGRDIIGLPEHLKNPSKKNIYEFAETFYVPNNMAVILSGDIDPDATIQLIDRYFGKMEKRDLPEIEQPVEEPIVGPIRREVFGPDSENISLAFRFDSHNEEQRKMVSMISMLLSNRTAGLIDLNLLQQQKILRGGSYSNFMVDYGMHGFYGTPRQGQTLEEVEELLLGQLDLIKQGEFDDWMLQTIVNDFRLSEIRRTDNNFARAYTYMDMFVNDMPVSKRLSYLDDLEKITKDDIVKFANENYSDNYVVVYKRFGESDGKIKVEKPQLTAVPMNREYQSDFYKNFLTIESGETKPVFLDFENEIQSTEMVPGVDMYYINNKKNEIFSLYYIIDIGKNHNNRFPLAVNYLPYLGTDKYSASELRQEFFKLGLNFGVSTGDKRSYVYITGLSKSFKEAVELLEHVVANAKPDQQAYSDYVDGILKERENNMKNQNTILWGAMLNYAIYGPNSSYRNVIQEDELRSIDPESLTDLIAQMTTFEHKVFYYGPAGFEFVRQELEALHQLPETLEPLPEPARYVQVDNPENKVYIVDYDMVQANIAMISKSTPFDKSLIPPAQLFGEYFGSGLSSIVFQEIRESRALAYSAFSAFSTPSDKEMNNIVYAFVGTQADKLEIATSAMLDLMNEMPEANVQFDLAKESIIKRLNTERIIKDRIFWTYLSNLDRGIDYDIRRDVYDYASNVTIDEFKSRFFEPNISGLNYNFMILGDKDALDMKLLKEIGETNELDLKYIFNYK
jgi:predicted Zn-dependent peptidase